MAEVAASIAGLVSLSIQVLEKAQTIREFYSRTKNAPQTLLDLTERLELLSLILRQAELFTQSDSSDVELVKRCISQCQRSSTKIKDLIEKLDRCLSKNGIPGKIRIAMRDSEFSKLLVEIDQTIALLEISFQMYTLCVFRSYECTITTSSDSGLPVRNTSNETKSIALSSQQFKRMFGRFWQARWLAYTDHCLLRITTMSQQIFDCSLPLNPRRPGHADPSSKWKSPRIFRHQGRKGNRTQNQEGENQVCSDIDCL